MLKIGLLGAGRIGQVHALSISRHEKSRLAAISDVVPEAAAALAAQYGADARATEEIIADPGIDAVLIATSTDTHADLIEAATAVGKPVLCEKPVDLSLARAKACLRTVQSRNARVMIGLNRRFDASFAQVRRSFVAGEIGKAELLAITSFDPAPPPVGYIKVSGGLFRDMTIHDFDMAQFILSDVPTTVHAEGSALVDPEIGAAGDIDTAVITLSYADGKIAVIKNSRRAAYGYDQRLELLGATGSLRVDNVTETQVVKSSAGGITGAKPLHFFLERYMQAYETEWNAFVTALDTGADMPVTLEDGVAALAVAEAATKSLAAKAPIAVDGRLS